MRFLATFLLGVGRAIRKSRRKWTPRKVGGVAQRTPYEVRVNYIND